MKLFSFKGRMRRRTFWIIMLIICAIEEELMTSTDAATYGILIVPIAWVSLASWTKRCHDCDYNGWWMFVPLFNFIFLFKKGDEGPNRYGDNPRNR